jgi:hypothetical protein
MIDCSPCSNATRMLRQVLAGLDRVTDPEFVSPLLRAVGTMHDTADLDTLPEVREAMDLLAEDLGDLRNEINAFLSAYHGWSTEENHSLDEMDALTHVQLGRDDMEFLNKAARFFGHASGLLSACASFCTGPGVRLADFRQAVAVTICALGQQMENLEIVRPPVLEMLDRMWRSRDGHPEGPNE